MSNFKKYWWKLLGVLLLVFAVYKSFNTPLSPGIAAVNPITFSTGSQQINVIGYATNFYPETKFWLAANELKFAVPAKISSVKNSGEATISVIIPDSLPVPSLDIIASGEKDGTCVLAGAVYVKDAKIVPGLANAVGQEINGLGEKRKTFPFRTMLYESIRNLNFHVTMWFALLACMLISVIRSIQYLGSSDLKHDREAHEGVNVGLLFGTLGLITGSIWARFTWGDWWVSDTKLNGAAISVLIYLAYLVLRNSINEEQKRARIVAVYNIFAFVMMIVFIQVLPRLTDSLHPGNGGNPAFSQYDLDNSLRAVFYPAALGWMLVGTWIVSLRSRMSHLNYRIQNHA